MKNKKELQDAILNKTTYKGIPCLKNPMDLWVYQEIIFEVKPDIIIEIGVSKGGSLMWLADHSKALIIGIDLDINKVKIDDSYKDRIKLLQGNAADQQIFSEVQNKIMDYKDYLIAQAQQINFTGGEILFVIFFAPLFALMVYDALISKK